MQASTTPVQVLHMYCHTAQMHRHRIYYCVTPPAPLHRPRITWRRASSVPACLPGPQPLPGFPPATPPATLAAVPAADGQGEDEAGVGAVLAATRPQTAMDGEDTSSTDEDVAAAPTGGVLPLWRHTCTCVCPACFARQASTPGYGCTCSAALLPLLAASAKPRRHRRCRAAAAAPAARRHLSPELRRAAAALLLRLASKAQFAKVGHAGQGA